jgi:hypothetical protein
MEKKAKKRKAGKKVGPEKGLVYFSKRALIRAVTKGTKNEEAEAMELLGYTVKEEDGWVIKQYENGEKEQISKIGVSISSEEIELD